MTAESNGIRILFLPQEVVDKIAAGEVVVRPVNAVKELIENSLDAAATEITVTIRKGGLDLIKVQDNGSGIECGDMSVVCARFATSKLKEYEDLSRMSTFGFRGEALASISYVSKVSIISRTIVDKCAHRANYQDGKMVGSLTLSAGLKGTIISAENLFYNAPARHRAMKYPQDEANRIIDLLVKYAIHYPNVAFAFRRLDGASSDFRTSGTGDRSATIRTLLGARITRELMCVDVEDQRELHFAAKACFTAPLASHSSVAIQSKQDRHKYFHVFINGRNVELPRLKQAVDLVFSSRDTTCQFMTVSLQIDLQRIDVNVHPTKSVVHFLNEDKVIEKIEQELYKVVDEYTTNGMVEIPRIQNLQDRTSESLRSLSVNTEPLFLTPSGNNSANKRPKSSTFEAKRISSFKKQLETSTSSTNLTSQRVRIDTNNRSLDEFGFTVAENDNCASPVISETHLVSLATSTPIRTSEFNRSMAREFDFDSLKTLREAICLESDSDLTKLFQKHYFVGFYSNEFGVFQVDSSAYIVKLDAVLREFFYQLIVFSFGNMGSYQLEFTDSSSPNEMSSVIDLVRLHFEINEMPVEEDGYNRAAHIVNTIVALSDLLWDYFSVGVSLEREEKSPSLDDEGDNTTTTRQRPFLKSLPCVINGYIPPMEALPELLYDLGTVNCKEETSCFRDIVNGLAKFYTPLLTDCNQENDLELFKMSLKRFVFPLLKSKFLPSKKLWNCVQKITSIEEAFKKFGRC